MDNVGDATATALLVALAKVSRLLVDKASKLQVDAKMSDVTYELSIDGPVLEDDLSGPARDAVREHRMLGSQEIVVSGYVDGKPHGQHGAAWLFNVSDIGSTGWQLSRQVILYPLAGENIEHHLPDIDFRNWRELAEALPRLVEQLLAEALPSHDDR